MGFNGNNRLGLYVHVPFCVKKCNYCAFYSEPVEQYDVSRLVSAVIRHIDSYELNKPTTLYIGGGSPSCLPFNDLMRLVEKVAGLNADAEFSVEVNPAQVNMEMLKGLRERGVTRLSVGAQSFSSYELELLGRIHGPDDITRAVDMARESGFKNISVDLIFAIPGSTLHTWVNSLNASVLLDVEHISAYSLSYEKGTPLMRMKKRGDLDVIDEETDRVMYEETIDLLGRSGYDHYEISNFAKSGFECEHNLGYWRNYEYVGVGPAAGSFYNERRYTNVSDINKYTEMIEAGGCVREEEEMITREAFACETMVLGLRLRNGVNLDEFEDRTGFDAHDIFGDAIERYKGWGFLEIVDGRLCLTKTGLPVADRVFCDFADF